MICELFPGLSLRSNPGLKLANAFGVKIKLCPTNYRCGLDGFAPLIIGRSFETRPNVSA